MSFILEFHFSGEKKGPTWNPQQPFINGCFNWMIPNLYIKNGCFTKHPFINGCLGFQVQLTSPMFVGVTFFVDEGKLSD